MSQLPLEGMRCMVYQDPLTCEKFEGEASIVKILAILDYDDNLGRSISRCLVQFADADKTIAQREISHLL